MKKIGIEKWKVLQGGWGAISRINDSFRILLMSRFQNNKSLNLMKKLLRYSRLKARLNFQKSKVEIKLNFEGVSIVFNIKYLSQNFIKLSILGVFWNPHDKQISKLSLALIFDEDFTQKKGKNRCRKVKAAHCVFKVKHQSSSKNLRLLFKLEYLSQFFINQ